MFTTPLPTRAARHECLGDAAFPPRLSQTGCYTDIAANELVGELVPYTVNAPLWSDGARKRRAFALPANGRISVSSTGAFSMPPGAVALKEFWFPRAADGARQMIETRLMVSEGWSWRFATYVWDRDGRDARLVATGETIPIETVEHGAPVRFDYAVPESGQCRLCHSSGNPALLGMTTEQLDIDVTYAGARRNQLEALREGGFFSAGSAPAPDVERALVDYRDESIELSRRAQSYLHAQCAHCHRPGGFSPSASRMDLRWSARLERSYDCSETSSLQDHPAIVPGNPEASNVWRRLNGSARSDRMPLLGAGRVDPEGSLVSSWIAAMRGVPCQ